MEIYYRVLFVNTSILRFSVRHHQPHQSSSSSVIISHHHHRRRHHHNHQPRSFCAFLSLLGSWIIITQSPLILGICSRLRYGGWGQTTRVDLEVGIHLSYTISRSEHSPVRLFSVVGLVCTFDSLTPGHFMGFGQIPNMPCVATATTSFWPSSQYQLVGDVLSTQIC